MRTSPPLSRLSGRLLHIIADDVKNPAARNIVTAEEEIASAMTRTVRVKRTKRDVEVTESMTGTVRRKDADEH